MSADPSINHCGWAIWDANTWDTLCPPVAAGVIHTANNTDELKYKELWDRLALFAQTHNVRRVFVEWPSFYSSGKGYAAAESGALVKLVAAAAVVLALGVSRGTAQQVPVNQWKGNTPKPVVTKRIIKRLGESACTALALSGDAWDAVGIGLYMKGCF